MCVSCNQSISYGDIQDLKTGCFIKQNPARKAGFLFVMRPLGGKDSRSATMSRAPTKKLKQLQLLAGCRNFFYFFSLIEFHLTKLFICDTQNSNISEFR